MEENRKATKLFLYNLGPTILVAESFLVFGLFLRGRQ